LEQTFLGSLAKSRSCLGPTRHQSLLKAAGYDHAFHKVGRQAIDELLECDPGDPGKFRAIGNG
jgi:hypothetical protein